jgi:hypothetical protein
VSVTPAAAAEGSGSAALPITLDGATTANGPSQPITYDLPVVWRFSDPLNAPIAIVAVVIVAVVSVLLPLLAMGIANKRSAKFDVAGLRYGLVKATLRNDQVMRIPLDSDEHTSRDPNLVLDVWHDGQQALPAEVRDPTDFELRGVRFRAKGSLNPFEPPSFTAAAPPGARILSSSSGREIPGNRAANVGAGLGFVVLAIVTDAFLASAADALPVDLLFLARDTAKFNAGEPGGSPGLADVLMNREMVWSKITDWRPDPAQRVDLPDREAQSPSPSEGRRSLGHWGTSSDD